MRFKWLLPLSLLFVITVSAQQQEQSPTAQWQLPKIDRLDLGVIDKNLSPCDDFYKFVCSKWVAVNPIPKEEASWGTSSNLQIYNETILRNALQAASVAKNRTPNQQLIGDYWSACMDESGIEKAGIAPIKADLDRIAAMKSKSDLPTTLAAFHNSVPAAWAQGNNQTTTALFGFGSNPDFKDSSIVVAGFDQGGMGMPGRDYYLSTDEKMVTTRNKYVQHVQKMFELAGEKPEQANADAATVLNIETQLAKNAMDIVKRRDPANINNVMSVAEIKGLAPSFDWERYLKLVNSPTPKHYIVTSPDFFRGLEPLLKSESLENWKTYLRWWTLNTNANYLNKAMVDEHFDFFSRTLYGLQENQPRWRRCVNYADRDLGEALGQAYVDIAFPPESKRRMDEMVNAIEAALSRDIDTLEWMSPATKKEAQEKLKAIYNKIGYPKKWIDYSSVKVVPHNFVANVRQATTFEFKRQLNKIGKPVDREEYTMTPPTINAYNDSQQNTINFPAGILQPPYFDAQLGDPENYGAIGMVIGHEISHGFDDQGRKFDSKGSLRDWWTPEDAKGYDERAACISKSYTHDVPELGVKTNGALTLGEDSADIAGMRISLLALEDTYKKKGKSLDEKDETGYTPRQRFFLSHAFSWCNNIRPDFARFIITTNPHSLPEYRVNYVEKNLPEFHEAFGCKQGQNMVPANVCRVW
jgi:endothelin-converting enzyme/putative endopeptidase